MTNMWWELMALVEWHYATENSYANMFQSIPRDHESVSRMTWRMVLSVLTTHLKVPQNPFPSNRSYHLALLHRQQFMYHRRVLCHQLRPIYEPPATILEPPTLDETTSTPVRSKPATCGTCTPLWRLSVSPIPYPPSSLAKGQSQTPVSRKPQQCPSAIATRGPTRTRKRPAWQSSGDYDNIMSTG